MIDQDYGQMSPVYVAMGMSSATVAWLQKQERERSDWELQFHLSKLGSAIQDLLDKRPVPTVVPPVPKIDFVVCCLNVITSLTGTVIKKAKDDLPNASERFRQPIAFLLEQLEEMVDAVEDVTETWAIQLDKDLSERIGSALRQIDSSKETIPDWREALELISD